jgi:hypothetical protein
MARQDNGENDGECHHCEHLLTGGWVGEEMKGEGDEEDHDDIPPIPSLKSS